MTPEQWKREHERRYEIAVKETLDWADEFGVTGVNERLARILWGRLATETGAAADLCERIDKSL